MAEKTGALLAAEPSSDQPLSPAADEPNQSPLAGGYPNFGGPAGPGGAVLVCTRTSGCTKQAGHQGFCSGHKGFKRKTPYDNFVVKTEADGSMHIIPTQGGHLDPGVSWARQENNLPCL